MKIVKKIKKQIDRPEIGVGNKHRLYMWNKVNYGHPQQRIKIIIRLWCLPWISNIIRNKLASGSQILVLLFDWIRLIWLHHDNDNYILYLSLTKKQTHDNDIVSIAIFECQLIIWYADEFHGCISAEPQTTNKKIFNSCVPTMIQNICRHSITNDCSRSMKIKNSTI